MKDFIDYIVKNKYVIICVGIVVALYAFGLVEFLSKVIILVGLIILAVFVGKKLQDNEHFFKDLFAKVKTKTEGVRKENIYYYKDEKDKK